MNGQNHKAKAAFGYERVDPKEKTERVQNVFDNSADRYDLMNEIMSLGMHMGWKRKAVEYAQLLSGDQVLDLACGTCDITRILIEKNKTIEVFATDPNMSMMQLGRDQLLDQGIYQQVHFACSFAENLPYADQSFQVVICAFGFRNFTHQQNALKEIYRVLKPGGQIIILEFSQPQSTLMQMLYRPYTKLIPQVGHWVSGQASSYQYLVDSIDNHISKNELIDMFKATGFSEVRVTKFLSGLVCIHRGIKC